MTDLRALAKAAHSLRHHDTLEAAKAKVDFQNAADAATVLALYAERDEARADAASWRAQAQRCAQDAVDFGTRAEASLAAVTAERDALRRVLTRCRTILGNMAKENEGAIFYRWPIAHEPLRADARHLLPIIDEALTKETPHAG